MLMFIIIMIIIIVNRVAMRWEFNWIYTYTTLILERFHVIYTIVFIHRSGDHCYPKAIEMKSISYLFFC